jgi:hypothetical protein
MRTILSLLLLAATPAAGAQKDRHVHVSGFVRSYYFTRQNASNNPGAHTVNQATLNNAIDLRAEYRFNNSWSAGLGYFYANPLSSCSDPSLHVPSSSCVTQQAPNLNPDDTVPGFILHTLDETYVQYRAYNVYAKAGNQIFNSPWAGPVDTRVKPAAFQGVDFIYANPAGWTYEAADMLRFEPRTSSTFLSSTLLTSFPAGNQGIAKNIVVPGCTGYPCTGITSSGFTFAHLGFAPPQGRYSANVYDWRVSNIVNIAWGDARYTFGTSWRKPYIALQGGLEGSIGAAYAGKIASSMLGIQLGVNITKNIVLAGSFDTMPWRYDNVVLPKDVTCTNTSGTKGYYQIAVSGVTFPYMLPVNAAQCFSNKDGSTTIAYGGWASPYTDNYATNPVFTTQVSQGVPDRRAAGNSWKIAATYTSTNQRFIFIASDASYDYGNAIAPQRTAEFNLDGTYRFAEVNSGPYKGLQLRYRYAKRTYSNTFTPAGVQVLGGVPYFKYNRAMLEYDF